MSSNQPESKAGVLLVMALFFASVSATPRAQAAPLDGNYYSSFGSDDYFIISGGQYKPAYSRGPQRAISDFTETSPLILRDNSSGVYYCHSKLRTSTGGRPTDAGYPMEQYRCTRQGWVYVSR